MKRPTAVVEVNTLEHDCTKVTLRYADGTTDHVNVKHIFLAQDMVNRAKDGDLKLFRALKEMNKIGENGSDSAVLAAHLAEEWKKSPCMYLGTPNKVAMLLLTGLRRKVSPGVKSTSNGAAIRDKAARDLYESGLMNDVKDGYRHLYMTNLNGFAVLQHWAEKNKQFAPYFTAYTPKDWYKKECERVAFAVMEGKESGLYPDTLPNLRDLVQGVHAIGSILQKQTP